MKEIIMEMLKGFEDIKTGIKERLVDYPGIADVLTIHLDKSINFLKTKIGHDVNLGNPGDGEFPVITKLRGNDFEPGKRAGNLTPVPKVDLKAEQEKANAQEATELSNQVDMLEPLFLQIESDKILDEHPDLVIRGVAKRAGLPVTEESPAKIDVKFINEIKAAIEGKANLTNMNPDLTKAPDPLTAEITNLKVDLADDAVGVKDIINKYSETSIKAVATEAGVPDQKHITEAFVLKIVDGLAKLNEDANNNQ